jgi:hypothetical protein
MKRLLVFVLFSYGCGRSLPQPELATHPEASEWIPIDYPPPPARPEHIDQELAEQRATQGCVWIDGHYRFQGRGWRWVSGGFYRPPEGCGYAPAVTTWIAEKRGDQLYYRAPGWYPRATETSEKASCEPAVSCDTSEADPSRKGAADPP